MAFSPVQLPSGRWQGGFRHPVTRREITQTFDYAYEAEAWAVVEEERARGLTPPPEQPAAPTSSPTWLGPTVGDYGRAYLDRRAGLLARATREKYDAHLTGLALQLVPERPPIAARPMGTLRRADVEQWVTDSRTAGAGAPSINGRLRFLRQLYADLIADDDTPIERDPTAGLRMLAEDDDPDRVLTVPEELRLLAAAGPQLAAAALVALDAGLRWQEVYGLRAEAVVGEYLVVSHVVERGTTKLRAYTKGKRKRVVPMTQRLAAALEPLVAQAPSGAGLLFPALGRADRPETFDPLRPWDYANHRKREWAPALLGAGFAAEIWRPTNRIRKYGPDAGTPVLQRRIVPEFGFHSLRHTYGSRLAAAGVPRSEIAALMGHANEATTSRYIHAGDDGRRLELVRAALSA